MYAKFNFHITDFIHTVTWSLLIGHSATTGNVVNIYVVPVVIIRRKYLLIIIPEEEFKNKLYLLLRKHSFHLCG